MAKILSKFAEMFDLTLIFSNEMKACICRGVRSVSSLLAKMYNQLQGSDRVAYKKSMYEYSATFLLSPSPIIF